MKVKQFLSFFSPFHGAAIASLHGVLCQQWPSFGRIFYVQPKSMRINIQMNSFFSPASPLFHSHVSLRMRNAQNSSTIISVHERKEILQTIIQRSAYFSGCCFSFRLNVVLFFIRFMFEIEKCIFVQTLHTRKMPNGEEKKSRKKYQNYHTMAKLRSAHTAFRVSFAG